MNWKIISFLFVFVALHCRANGGKKSGVKVVNLQRKLHQKIFHQHHHHYHSHHHDNNHHQHHHPHHQHNHDGEKHPSHQHHRHNLHHHNPIKHYLHHHHNQVHHPHHHHHHHHHHTNHRNPIQYYHHQDHHPKHQHHHQHHHPHHQDLGHRHHHHHHHHHHYHHHHHPHNVHHQPKPKVPPTKKPVHIQQHLVNRTSNISHRPNSSTSSKLQLHVQIQNVQAVKRDSLPNLLSTLGKNLMELGTSMSPKKSEVPVNSTDGLEQKENATKAFPIPQFSFAAEGLSSSSAAIPASSHQVKVSSVDLQMLLHKALDGENDDYVESGSGSGSGDRQNDTEDSISDTSTTKNEPIHYQNQSSTEGSERRNQTFPGERDHYPPDGLDNYSNENESHDTQNTYGKVTDELVQRNTGEAHLDGRSNSQFAQGGRNASSEKEGLEDNDQSDQSQTSPFQEMFENGTSSESSPVTNQTLLDETKRPDTNASFYDSEGIVEKGNENSGLKQPEKHATEQHVSQNTKELEEDDAGVSGDQGSSESGENIDENLEDEEGYHHISYQGEANERGLSNGTITGNDEGGSVVDEDSGSAENTDTYGFGNATYSDSEEEIDFNKATEKESTEEHESQVREEEISKNVTVNFSRNPVFPENQSEPSVHQIRAKKLNSGDSVGSINETEEEGLFDAASEIGIRNKTDVESERDVYTTKAKKAEAIDKSKSPVQEEHIGKPATVNFAGNNAISENQSYPSFDQVRSKKSNSEGIVDTINATDDRLLDHALLNEFNQSADANELTQGFSATNAYVPSNEEMERPLSQPLINSSTSVTSDESFDQIRTNKTSSKDFDYSGNLQDSRLDHGVLKETNLSSNEVGLTQGFAAKEGDKFSDMEFEPPTTHPLLDDSTRGILEAHGEKGAEPEGSDPSTYHVDSYDRQNDVDIPDKPENTTLYENDEASVGQESMEEGISKQDQRLQIDNTTLPEGPLSAHSYSSSVDTEGTQLTDAQLTTSPDNSTTDETDDIPVYTVSMPSKVDSVGRDSTADDQLQSRVSEAPIASFNTPSALAYSEQSTLPREEESMFNVLNQTVKEDFGYNPQPTQRVVFQRDMLDDPVEESLDSTVDSS